MDQQNEFFIIFDYEPEGSNKATRWHAFALLCAIVLASVAARLWGLWPGWEQVEAWLKQVIQ